MFVYCLSAYAKTPGNSAVGFAHRIEQFPVEMLVLQALKSGWGRDLLPFQNAVHLPAGTIQPIRDQRRMQPRLCHQNNLVMI